MTNHNGTIAGAGTQHTRPQHSNSELHLKLVVISPCQSFDTFWTNLNSYRSFLPVTPPSSNTLQTKTHWKRTSTMMDIAPLDVFVLVTFVVDSFAPVLKKNFHRSAFTNPGPPQPALSEQLSRGLFKQHPKCIIANADAARSMQNTNAQKRSYS
jgi:hypothetical protein